MIAVCSAPAQSLSHQANTLSHQLISHERVDQHCEWQFIESNFILYLAILSVEQWLRLGDLVSNIHFADLLPSSTALTLTSDLVLVISVKTLLLLLLNAKKETTRKLEKVVISYISLITLRGTKPFETTSG